MKTAATIIAGLLAGIVVAGAILAAFVFVGPDPVGLRPTPTPSSAPSVSPLAPSPSVLPSPVSGSPTPSASPNVSGGSSAHLGQPVPVLAAGQPRGGTTGAGATTDAFAAGLRTIMLGANVTP
jgi:hypothetical protein